jgi:phosphate transport system substrate-binding protein
MVLFATGKESDAGLHALIGMQALRQRRLPLMARGLALSTCCLLLNCCGAPDGQAVRIVGSSTVYPFTTAVVEQFKRDNPTYAAPVVEATGTGGGIKLFCSGSGVRYPDIANASRRILPSEFQDCDAHGVKSVVEVQIGLDGLVIAQSRAGSMPGLTERDVYAALAAEPFGRGPNRAQTWADVRADLPAQKIEVIGPPPTSGTRDSFNALYMTRGCLTDPAMQALQAANPARFKLVCSRIREDGAFIDGGENDNLTVHKVAANPAVLGLFGFSFLEQNRDKIRDVPLSGVEATYANIASFRYPASRPMFLYVKGERARANAAMQAFLAEYTREATWGANGYLARRGMVPSAPPVRAHNAAIVAALVPLDRAGL